MLLCKSRILQHIYLILLVSGCMGKEQCAICGREPGMLERLSKADSKFGPEIEGKHVCYRCINKNLKEETNEKIGKKSVKYVGEMIRVVQMPTPFYYRRVGKN